MILSKKSICIIQLKFWLLGREITQLTFYVLSMSQDQASKSLFWCNLPLTILSEYPLDSRLLLCILLYPLPSNCCSFFDFPLFCFFFFFNYNYHFWLNFFWLTSSGGCPNHTFRRLKPQGAHNQGDEAHLARMHLQIKSSVWHCSFKISSHLLVRRI